MIEGQNIVYIGNDWFTENKTSSHHIAEIMSKNNRLLYVEGAGQRTPQLSKRDLRKILLKFKKLTNGPFQVKQNIFVYSPFLLPFHKYKIIRAINSFLLIMQIQKACRTARVTNPLLWILLPHFYSLVGKMNEKGVVYYCVDEYSAQPNVDVPTIQKMEKTLLQKADIVFTVSESLLSKKQKINSNTYLSLHGVDLDHFKNAMIKTSPLPQDIASIPGPIIGFFGLLQPRVDLKLVKFLSEKRPDFSFVLIGLVAQDISMFSTSKNVYFLGAKPYDSLPNYLRSFDVAILPYRLDEEMKNSNPKKTREYLAGGKPVVSVRIREVEKYGNLVYIADGYKEFLQSIETAILEDSEEKRNARMYAMDKESWDYRYEEICKKVEKHVRI